VYKAVDAGTCRSDLKSSRDALAESGRLSSCADVQPALEVRVYRRSTETLAMLDDRRRAQSLPRGMELNRSVGSDLHASTTNSRRGSLSATGHSSRPTSRKASARSSVVSISAFKGPSDLPVVRYVSPAALFPVTWHHCLSTSRIQDSGSADRSAKMHNI